MKKQDMSVLFRDTREYDCIIRDIICLLETSGMTHLESLGVLDIIRDEIHAQRWQDIGGED